MKSIDPRSRRSAAAAAGFTLIELLTVIAIVGVLAALLLPTLGGSRNSALRAQTKVRFTQWMSAMEQFRQEYGYYPAVANEQRLDAAGFLAALTARDHRGQLLSGAALNGNAKAIAFYAVAESEIVHGADGAPRAELVDAFGNSEIVVLADGDGDGVIGGAELVAVAVRAGNSQSGFGPPVAPRPEDLPATGIRAGVAFYSAGRGTSSDDLVYSWR